MEKKMKLNGLMRLLLDNGMNFALHSKGLEHDGYNYYITITDEKNLYKSEKHQYFNMLIDEKFYIQKIQFVINHKDENHAFINVSYGEDIMMIAYNHFNQ